MKFKKMFIIMIIGLLFTSCESGFEDMMDEANAYDNSVVYNLRDTGPAGGIIFYINPNYETDGWRYLEAAPAGWSGSPDDPFDFWTSEVFKEVPCPGTSTEVGTGMVNTLAILQQNGNADCAAKRCRDYNGGDYSDWFLPSRDDMYWMCWNLYGIKHPTVSNPDVPVSIGGFRSHPNTYWSSSQHTTDSSAYNTLFSSGLIGYSGKRFGSGFYVRPARRF